MAKIIVDFSKRNGMVKPLHGVNNGPVCYGSLIDVTHYYQAAGIPHVRLHDPNWPHPREVDIYSIFPDFNADPDSPSSYDFRRTDDYIKSVLETGAEIIYRLGVSIEHTQRTYYIDPPTDYEKWAKICIGIIKHYNNGWADGFNYNIKYWEIWNEPDNPNKKHMWTGTPEQYYELYKVASTAIKKYDPNLKIGAFGATNVNFAFAEDFICFCRNNNLELDFFSWHSYVSNPEDIRKNAAKAAELLDKYEYFNTESHINEWNYVRQNVLGWNWLDGIWGRGHEFTRAEVFNRQKSEEGAAFCASVITILHDSRIDVSNYYDGQPTATFCGLFDYYGVPQKTYYAFKAFSELLNTPERVVADIVPSEEKGLYCLAGTNTDSSSANVLISSFGKGGGEFEVDLSNLPEGKEYTCEVYKLDQSHTLELTGIHRVDTNNSVIRIFMDTFSVVLLKLR